MKNKNTNVILRFTAKHNLPGDIKKGDKIEYRDGIPYLIKNNKSISYDCLAEPTFFEQEKELLHPIGTTVHTLKTKRYNVIDGAYRETVEFLPFAEVKVVDGDDKNVIVEVIVKKVKKRIAIPVKEVVRSGFWFFWNTDGIMCKEIIGRHPKKEEFCRSIGNCFDNSIDGVKWVVTLKKLTTKK